MQEQRSDTEEESDAFNVKECFTHDNNSNAQSDCLSTWPTNFNLIGPEPEEAEMAEDLEFLKVLPSLFGGPHCEVTDSEDPLWHTLSSYPGWRRVDRVKNEWLQAEEDRNVTSNQPVWEDDGAEMTWKRLISLL